MKIKHLLVAALLVSASPVLAQEDNDAQGAVMPPLPADTAVVTGHLDNGLTYYIRHNNYPEGKVNFYIAQRVGAVQEEDDQDGLAHFLEHMAFNGSKHFPDDSVTKFMDGLGAQWNAFTTADHTVYHVNGVSNDRESALDSCLLLLSDWSEGLTLDEKQLNEQRDVVHNEYRSHGAPQRLLYQALPYLYPDSRYGTRTVIGSMDVIDHCNSNRLRDYYHKWYYPANQAIVIVGDIDPHKWEAKVKKLFSPLPVPKTAHKATDLQVADNDTTLYFAGSDKEMPATYFLISHKDEVVDSAMKQTVAYVLYDDMRELGSSMFNDRLRRLSQQPDAAFVSVSTYDGDYMTSRTRQAQTTQVLPKPGKEAEALRQALTEMKRVAEFGFTESELKQAKETMKAELDKQYNNRKTITNDAYAQNCIENYLNHEPTSTVEELYPIHSQILPMLNLQMLNMALPRNFSIDPQNLAVAALAQQKDGKPVITVDEMKKIVDEVRKAEVTAPVDTFKEEPLMKVLPTPGKITKEKKNAALGYTELTLSNGAKVILKKTDFKANEILAMAVAPGGNAVAKKENLVTRQLFDELYSLHGLGTKSVMDLVSLAQRTQTEVSDGISNDLHYINGSTTNENLETMMQAINLCFTGSKRDESFEQQIMQMLKSQISAKYDNPDAVISDSADYYEHSQHADNLTPDADQLDNVNFANVFSIRNKMFSNAADFTFIFVGSFDEQKIRPLIAQYIASLPGKKEKANVEDNRFYTEGKVKREFTKAMATPQSVTTDLYRSAKVPFTLKNLVNTNVLAQVLWNKEFDIIREQESAAYTPQPSARIDNDLTGTYILITSQLQTNPEKTARAEMLADSIVTNTAKWVTADDVQKGREAILKSHADNVKKNSYWLDVLSDYAVYGVDKYTGFDEALKAVTPQSVGEIANTVLSAGNHVRVTMNAVKNK